MSRSMELPPINVAAPVAKVVIEDIRQALQAGSSVESLFGDTPTSCRQYLRDLSERSGIEYNYPGEDPQRRRAFERYVMGGLAGRFVVATQSRKQPQKIRAFESLVDDMRRAYLKNTN